MPKPKPKLKYLVAGLQKAGTTSVHDALSKSNKFNLPYDKELVDFFSVLDSGVSSVDTLFTSVATEFAIVSPTAGCSELFLQNIRDKFDINGLKVFILWRSSRDRVRSHLKMLLRRGDIKPDLQSVSRRLRIDSAMYMEEYEGAKVGNGGSGSFSLENVFRNSCVTTYVRTTKKGLECKDEQIAIVTIDGIFGELGLELMEISSNDSSKVRHFDYKKVLRCLKEVKIFSVLFHLLPRVVKSYIFWQIQTRYSIHDPKVIDKIVNEALDTSEYDALFESLDRAAAKAI
jgi:hypothetical protein